jgi:hypothetical protein
MAMSEKKKILHAEATRAGRPGPNKSSNTPCDAARQRRAPAPEKIKRKIFFHYFFFFFLFALVRTRAHALEPGWPREHENPRARCRPRQT